MSRNADGVALVLRTAAGVVLLFAGLQKVLPGPAFVTAYFRDLGLPWPELLGPGVGLLELLGGMALLAGLLTRVVAGLFVAEMLVALAVARLPVALASTSAADAVATVRTELLLLAGCACLVLAGGGRWSLDARMGRRHAGQRA